MKANHNFVGFNYTGSFTMVNIGMSKNESKSQLIPNREIKNTGLW